MKTQRIVAVMAAIGLVLTSLVASNAAQDKTSAQTLAAFEKIKGLAGAWVGSYSAAKGAIKHARYDVVSNGMAVILIMDWGSDGNMATVFHLDGDAVIATHYCPVGNQPRMRANISGERNAVEFRFQDATNLSRPSDWHMRDLKLVFDAPDQHTLHWTYFDNGKEETGTFKYKRNAK